MQKEGSERLSSLSWETVLTGGVDASGKTELISTNSVFNCNDKALKQALRFRIFFLYCYLLVLTELSLSLGWGEEDPWILLVNTNELLHNPYTVIYYHEQRQHCQTFPLQPRSNQLILQMLLKNLEPSCPSWIWTAPSIFQSFVHSLVLLGEFTEVHT